MILVDSSVWVDYFNGLATPETDYLDAVLGREPVAMGDLVLAEVLQGFRSDSDYAAARKLLAALPIHELLDAALAIKVSENYRALRKKGITVRKTADTIIATYCIERGIPLLFSDRDFIPFVRHLGLKSVLSAR